MLGRFGTPKIIVGQFKEGESGCISLIKFLIFKAALRILSFFSLSFDNFRPSRRQSWIIIKSANLISTLPTLDFAKHHPNKHRDQKNGK